MNNWIWTTGNYGYASPKFYIGTIWDNAFREVYFVWNHKCYSFGFYNRKTFQNL